MPDLLPICLATPYIELGISVESGLQLLRSMGCEVSELSDREHSFEARTLQFGVAIYVRDDVVGSVWYDDPLGRSTAQGRADKIRLYLKRYGTLSNWELRVDSGSMHYWFNPIDRASMVYGIHNDVIRFNQYVAAPN